MSAAAMIAPNNYRAGNTRYNQHRGARKATAYCKVCHDAGRPKSEYTSHFVKDKKGPGGKVVCPLLLNQECRYCHKKGHTLKSALRLRQKKPGDMSTSRLNVRHVLLQIKMDSVLPRSSPSSP